VLIVDTGVLVAVIDADGCDHVLARWRGLPARAKHSRFVAYVMDTRQAAAA